jgi:hypothetical protein
MKLNHALNKIGVEIVKQHAADASSATLMLRVPQKNMGLWAQVIEEFLLGSTQQPSGAMAWTTDVSRAYFVDKSTQSVRYLWRVVLNGNVQGAAEALGMAAIRALSSSIEVTSQPLVGRMSYDGTKGAHSMGAAQALVAQNFATGGKS